VGGTGPSFQDPGRDATTAAEVLGEWAANSRKSSRQYVHLP
jgi:hypothetical protein